MRAVFADNEGSSAYFPLKALVSHTPRNYGRPDYEALNLPVRTKQSYVDALDLLDEHENDAFYLWQTGILHRTLLGFAPFSVSPFFYPIDPFHLLHLNVPSHLWNVWLDVGEADAQGRFGLHQDGAARLGLFISNTSFYPTLFSSRAPRDISTSVNSNYRISEWQAVFHHFLPAYLFDVGAPQAVQDLLSMYLVAVDSVMAPGGLTKEQIHGVRKGFSSFVTQFEEMYCTGDAELDRMVISLHQLLHVPDQLLALGSVRATSQASCERYFGALKRHFVQANKMFQTLDNRILHQAQMHSVRVQSGMHLPRKVILRSSARTRPLSVAIRSDHGPLDRIAMECEHDMLSQLGYVDRFTRYGKMKLPEGYVRCTRLEKNITRSTARVAIVDEHEQESYGEVIHFLHVQCSDMDGDFELDLALVRDFNVTARRPTFAVGQWSDAYSLVDVSDIVEIAAVLSGGRNSYAVRKRAWQTAEDYIRRKDGELRPKRQGEKGKRKAQGLEADDEEDEVFTSSSSESEGEGGNDQ